MIIRAIAWDLDGTLVDSEPLHHRALLAGSGRLGADLSDLPENQFRGMHLHDVWTALAGRMRADVSRDDWLSAITDHYVAQAPSLAPLAGALAAIRSFAAAGLTQVCVSNSSRRIVDANIKALGIGRDIAFSISFDDVTDGKPDPMPYREACRRLDLAPAAVLAVEDSRTGLQSARAAGLRTAAVGPDLATDRTADIVVSDYADLVAWVADAQLRR